MDDLETPMSQCSSRTPERPYKHDTGRIQGTSMYVIGFRVLGFRVLGSRVHDCWLFDWIRVLH